MGFIDDRIRDTLLCKITYNAFNILWSEFLSSGSISTILCMLDNDEVNDLIEKIEPGTLVVLVLDKAEHTYIVGGGFYFRTSKFKPQEAWSLYGVRTGAISYETFLDEVKRHDGHEKSTLPCVILDSVFLFDDNVKFFLPDELRDNFQDRRCYHLSKEDPLALYLNKFVLLRRTSFLNKFGDSWQGVYKAASERNERAYLPAFNARVFAAYNNKCAITGTKATPVLKAINIQPFYDFTFQGAQNGILLRSDISQLFEKGYLTAYYENDTTIKVKLSKCSKIAWTKDYMQYDGAVLSTPKLKSLWPKKEFLEWHQHNCFEHWLHVGGTHL